MTDKQVASALSRNYESGTILFEEHDPGTRLFVIRSGRVKIFRRVASREVVLAMLGPGDFFGEMALLEGLPRSASAEAVDATTVIEVDSQTFEEMIRGNIEIAVRIMRKLASRVRELDRRLQNLLVDSGVGRAVEVLRWLLQQGTPEGEFVRVQGATAHVNIAAQKAHAEGMKGGDQRLGDRARANDGFDTAGHLRGSLVGEGHREDGVRRHADAVDEMRNAIGNDARLAAAGAGQDQHRPVNGLDRFPLLRIQLGQIRGQS